MNEMLFFLNKHIEITKTVFWIPDKHYFTRAIEILEKTSIKNVLIISLRDHTEWHVFDCTDFEKQRVSYQGNSSIR